MKSLFMKLLNDRGIRGTEDGGNICFLHPDPPDFECCALFSPEEDHVTLTAHCRMNPPMQLIPKLLFEINQLNCKHTFGNLELEDDALVYRLSSYLPDDPEFAEIMLKKLLKDFLAQAMMKIGLARKKQNNHNFRRHKIFIFSLSPETNL